MKDKIGKIAALCYQISEETDKYVFFDYSPHVHELCIGVHLEKNIDSVVHPLKCRPKMGWERSIGFYMKGSLYENGIEDKIISELEAMLKDSKNE